MKLAIVLCRYFTPPRRPSPAFLIFLCPGIDRFQKSSSLDLKSYFFLYCFFSGKKQHSQIVWPIMIQIGADSL